jgi:hypothetical protein
MANSSLFETVLEMKATADRNIGGIETEMQRTAEDAGLELLNMQKRCAEAKSRTLGTVLKLMVGER